jgi:hypothetical protein
MPTTATSLAANTDVCCPVRARQVKVRCSTPPFCSVLYHRRSHCPCTRRSCQRSSATRARRSPIFRCTPPRSGSNGWRSSNGAPHSPSQLEALQGKVQKLGKIAARHASTPRHLVAHAKSMSLLNLHSIQKLPEHEKCTMNVLMLATDSMTTEELESTTKNERIHQHTKVGFPAPKIRSLWFSCSHRFIIK